MKGFYRLYRDLGFEGLGVRVVISGGYKGSFKGTFKGFVEGVSEGLLVRIRRSIYHCQHRGLHDLKRVP